MPDQRDLTGTRHVRLYRSAKRQAWKLLPSARDLFELRAQALKLRFWPTPAALDEKGEVLDLNWCWIKALPRTNIGELRIDDAIGGMDNLRLIFWEASAMKHHGMTMIWILSALQKKRQEWTKNNLTTFDAQRRLVIQRFYKNGQYSAD